MMYSQGGSRPQSAVVRTPSSQRQAGQQQAPGNVAWGDEGKENTDLDKNRASSAAESPNTQKSHSSHSHASGRQELIYTNNSQQMDPPSSSGSDGASRPGSAGTAASAQSRQRPQSANPASQGRSSSGGMRPSSATIRVSGANGGPIKKPSRPSSAVARNYDQAFGREGGTGSSTAYYTRND